MMASTTAQTSARGGARDEPPPDAERDEAPQERLDRNQTELMTELRVAGAGVQVLFGFLLIVPFNNRWTALSSFDRDVYFVALICVAIAAVLLIAPMVHHRLLFREREKGYLVRVGNLSAIVAMVFLSVGLTAILVLVSNVVFGGLAPVIVGIIAAPAIGWLWFGVALAKRESG
jgi:amino acid transporter